jgi:hypothetical protein
LSLYREYLLAAEFRLCFKLTQSLAFLPENDVVDGYNYIYKYATDKCPQYIPILAYVEKVYIGTLKAARYPKPTWNCYKRVMSGASRTTNNVESWHGQLQADENKHIGIFKLIAILREEQGLTEAKVIEHRKGLINHKSKATSAKDNNIFNLCSKYNKCNIEQFLQDMSLNMGNQNKFNANNKPIDGDSD